MSQKPRDGWLPLLLAALLQLWLAAPTRAQSCHAPSLRETAGSAFRATLAGEVATYDNAHYLGEYQGLRVGAAYQHPRVVVGASLPYYRVVRNGLPQQGVGDVALDVRVPVIILEDLGLSFGPDLAVSFPTGDATRDLGMGHTMLMPGAFVGFNHLRLTVIGQLAYGRAIGGGHGTHHHGGAGPIVNPMNQSEVEHALGVGFEVVSALRVTARAFGAIPVFDDEGLTREVLSGGLSLVLGAFDLTVEQQFPVIGAPFESKTLATVAGQW